MRMIGQKMSKIRPLSDNILCTDGDFGDVQLKSGIIIKSTIGKDSGITARWFKVYSVGPDIDWLTPGQWVYVEYGRWTEGFTVKGIDDLESDQKIWKVDPKGCLAISDDKPETTNLA